MNTPTMPRRPAQLTTFADAVTRLDHGHGLPGDEVLAADFDTQCQRAADLHNQRIAQTQWDSYLASACVHCGPTGSTGPDCGDCPLPTAITTPVLAA